MMDIIQSALVMMQPESSSFNLPIKSLVWNGETTLCCRVGRDGFLKPSYAAELVAPKTF
jgi:hypothetical protein